MALTLLAERRKPSGERPVNASKPEGSRPTAAKTGSKVNAVGRLPRFSWVRECADNCLLYSRSLSAKVTHGSRSLSARVTHGGLHLPGATGFQRLVTSHAKSRFFLVNCESHCNVATACLNVFVDLIVKDALLDIRIAVYSQSGLRRRCHFVSGYVPSKIQQLT